MIGYLEGTVTARLNSSVLLLTTGGVGYQIHLPTKLLYEESAAGSPLRVFCSTIVRDTEITLFGFATLEGKLVFEELIKTSGVGPRLALAMLSAFSVNELRSALVRQDVALISTVPGIGKKTATRLCLELADRMAAAGPSSPDLATGASDGSTFDGVIGSTLGSGALLSALTNLGFPEKDAILVLSRLPAGDAPFQEQLKNALALLQRVP